MSWYGSFAWLAVGVVTSAGACNSADTATETQENALLAGRPCTEEREALPCGDDPHAEIVCVGAPTNPAELLWTACVIADCEVGARRPCPTGPEPGYQDCLADSNGVHWGECQTTYTPLVLSFDRRPAILSDAPGVFDLSPSMSVATDWPTSATPWLALDRNGNGRIDDGGELFGSATALARGGFAANGFEALAELDQNHDGQIDVRDASFLSLRAWSDANRNRTTDPGELFTLAEMGIESISLQFDCQSRCDARGNCEIESSSFGYDDMNGKHHVGRVADVHLLAR